jgi:hypothetical protein
MYDCIWCGDQITEEISVPDGEDHFHQECHKKYSAAIVELQDAYANPMPDVEVFIAGDTDNMR